MSQATESTKSTQNPARQRLPVRYGWQDFLRDAESHAKLRMVMYDYDQRLQKRLRVLARSGEPIDDLQRAKVEKNCRRQTRNRYLPEFGYIVPTQGERAVRKRASPQSLIETIEWVFDHLESDNIRSFPTPKCESMWLYARDHKPAFFRHYVPMLAKGEEPANAAWIADEELAIVEMERMLADAVAASQLKCKKCGAAVTGF